MSAQTGRPHRRVSVGAFIGGFFIALLFNFFLTLVYVINRLSNPPTTPEGIVAIIVAWLLTAGLFYGLYRSEPWLAYGAIGCYAALFSLLLIVGGATGPYMCFNAYGYPSPYR